MLKKKNIWDVVNISKLKLITTTYIKKKDNNKVISLKIIKQKVNLNFYINIIFN